MLDRNRPIGSNLIPTRIARTKHDTPCLLLHISAILVGFPARGRAFETAMTVEYRPVPGMSPLVVGSDGSLYTTRSGKTKRLKDTIFRTKYGTGYVVNGVAFDGKTRMLRRHRLVLEAFVGPCPPGMEGCHINDIKNDNRIENLRWATRSQNRDDSKANGTMCWGQKHPNYKIPDSEIPLIRAKYASGATIEVLAAEYGIVQSHMHRIVTRLARKHAQ